MLSLAMEALSLSRQIGFVKGEAASLNRISGALYVKGNYPKAMEITLRALKINEKINNVDGFHRNFNMLGNLYNEMGDYRQALTNYFKANVFAEKVNNKRSVSIILANTGKVYYRLEIFDSSKLYSQQAYDLALQINYPRQMGAALKTMAGIYSKTGQNELAFKYYRMSLSPLEKGENYDDLCDAYIGTARLFEKSGLTDSSLYYARQAEAIAREKNFPHILFEVNTYLSDFYKNHRNADSALFYLVAAKATNDSLFSREKIKQLQGLGFEEKLRQLEIEMQKEEAAKKRKREIIWFSVIGGLVLLSFIFIAQLRINFIRKAENEKTSHISQVAKLELQSQQAILNERLRISGELHDEVGATLSGIAMYSHLAKEQIKTDQSTEIEKSLNIMQQSSGEMVNKLNDIVWLINPEQDSLQKLIERLEEYATNMAVIKNMQVKVIVPEKIAAINLPVEYRRNIYLFCKEAINNAVKYSNGSLLELIIKETEGKLEFSVSDNGKGFDAVMVRRGNGLENMQKRADEIGAKLILQSKLSEGAMVSMQCEIGR
jgi:signal transduction histidine kinase